MQNVKILALLRNKIPKSLIVCQKQKKMSTALGPRSVVQLSVGS